MVFKKIILALSFLIVINQLTFAQVYEENFEIKALETGPKLARISVPRAIVYSDEEMNSPLGYISNGKLIYVGNPRKKNPELLSLLLNGQIAFIQSKDLHFEDEIIQQTLRSNAPKEHNIDLILKKPEEKLTENNSILFSLGQFGMGNQYQTMLENINEEKASTTTYFNINLLHRKEHSRLIWGIGWEGHFINTTNTSFSFFLLNPTMGWSFIKNSMLILDVLGSFDFLVGSEFDIKKNFDKDPSPFIYGPQVGARALFFPDLKYQLFGGLGLRHYYVTQMKTVFNENSQYVTGFNQMTGLHISFGISFNL